MAAIQIIKPPFAEIGNIDLTHPQMQGCIGWWAMLEGSGTNLYDLSPKHNTGVFADSTAAPAWTYGMAGPAVVFDGSNDYLSLSSAVGTVTGLNTGAISLRCNITTGGSHAWVGLISMDAAGTPYNFAILSLGDVTGTYGDESIGYSLYRDGSSVLGLYVRNGHTAYMDGLDHHIVLSIGSPGNAVYVDGVSQSISYIVGSSAMDELSNIDNPAAVEVGVYRGGGGRSGYAKGIIDDIRFYNKPLTQADVTSLYLNPFAPLTQEIDFPWAAFAAAPAYNPTQMLLAA